MLENVTQCLNIFGTLEHVQLILVSAYWLDDQGSIPVEIKDFSSSVCVQTSSEAHPAF
jgi:hypothetical protein